MARLRESIDADMDARDGVLKTTFARKKHELLPVPSDKRYHACNVGEKVGGQFPLREPPALRMKRLRHDQHLEAAETQEAARLQAPWRGWRVPLGPQIS